MKPSERRRQQEQTEDVQVPWVVTEAEQATIGSMLIDTEAARKVIRRLSAEDFHSEAHRSIYQAAFDCVKRDGTVDLTTIFEELKRTKRIDQAGGFEGVNKLLHSVSTHTHAEYYAQLVREASLDRQLDVQIKKTATDKTRENIKAIENIFIAMRGVREAGTFDFRRDLAGIIDDIVNKRPPILETGFKTLDRTLGGLDPGDVTTIGARTSGGKTAFMVKLCLQIAEQQQRECLYLTTEMTPAQILTRILPLATEIPAWRFRKRVYDKEHYKKITDACADRLSKLPIRVRGKTRLSLEDIHHAIAAAKPQVVFIDYLQRCILPEGDVRAYQVLEFMAELKTLAQDCGINIFIGCQLDRRLDKTPSEEPENADLKDSGGIEAESDQVILLWRPPNKQLLKEDKEVPENHYLVRSKISKNRHGSAWERADFLLNGPLVDMSEYLQPYNDPRDRGRQEELNWK